MHEGSHPLRGLGVCGVAFSYTNLTGLDKKTGEKLDEVSKQVAEPLTLVNWRWQRRSMPVVMLVHVPAG